MLTDEMMDLLDRTFWSAYDAHNSAHNAWNDAFLLDGQQANAETVALLAETERRYETFKAAADARRAFKLLAERNALVHAR